MRVGLVLVAVLSLGVLVAAGVSAGAAPDKGLQTPPAKYSDDAKAIWMTEWAACWRLPLGRMSKIFHLPITPSTTPQFAARKIGKKAVVLLYNTAPETAAGADGCRNGILWRYYHPPAAGLPN